MKQASYLLNGEECVILRPQITLLRLLCRQRLLVLRRSRAHGRNRPLDSLRRLHYPLARPVDGVGREFAFFVDDFLKNTDHIE